LRKTAVLRLLRGVAQAVLAVELAAIGDMEAEHGDGHASLDRPRAAVLFGVAVEWRGFVDPKPRTPG
jgi:hypothetical protein